MSHGKHDIFDMELHDVSMDFSPFTDSQLRITRVPGGWIYTHSGDGGSTSVFVPYYEEFKS